jgi:Tail tubular protein
MSTTTPYTELEAVNEMLGLIGQAPVNSLTVTVGDVLIARSMLAIQSRYVQLYGFNFNTDSGYTLSPDVNGFISMPTGALRVDPTDPLQDIAIRRHPIYGMGLYDRANQTWTMSTSIDCDITWGFGFEDMPDSARNYIALSAARKFQMRVIGSKELDGYAQEDEMRAWSMLLRDERNVRDTNAFRNSKSLARVTQRTGFGLAGGVGPVFE